MKKQYYLMIFLIFAFCFSQEAYMNISHQGIQPSTLLTVEVGQEITFEYGGGGSHPMTSGHGDTSSPLFFSTVTVTSSNPIAIFTLTEIGTYLFHCGTNPNNSSNWGTIIVEEVEIDIFYGDVNFDEVINVLDIISIVNHIFGASQLNDGSLLSADLNIDNIVNIQDILLIINLILTGENN